MLDGLRDCSMMSIYSIVQEGIKTTLLLNLEDRVESAKIASVGEREGTIDEKHHNNAVALPRRPCEECKHCKRGRARGHD